MHVATTSLSHPATTPQPAHGAVLSGAETVVQVLADEGVEVAFGYSGGAILPVYDAIYRFNAAQPGPQEALALIVPANEQAAGFMGSGYARASGRVGVVIVTSGPGATNTVTPVRDAMSDSIPMVVICGQVGTAAIGSDAFQEAPISNIMSSCAKHVFLITDPARLEATLRSAFEIARSGRPGPVVVDIPKDIQNAAMTYDGRAKLDLRSYSNRIKATVERRLDETSCARFLSALQRAQRPLIYAGGGIIAADASESLRAFASHFGLPITTTLMGIGVSDTRDRLSLHMLGMHGTAYANYAVDDCDMLIAIGARFDDRVAGTPSQFARHAKFIAQFDIDPAEIGKVKPVDWHHIGELNSALNQLRQAGSGFIQADGEEHRLHEWHSHLDGLKKYHALDYDRDNELIQPYAVIEAINRLTQGEAIISTGVGQHQMWAAQYFDFRRPRQWLTSGAMGTMGFGLPAALGAQIAHPSAIVIDIDGDASIRMNIGELETATTYQLPVKVVVLNNCGDGMVRQWQKLFYKGRFAASDKSLHTKDFIKAAEADGFAWARRISQPDEIEAAVQAMLAFPGPTFLEVMIDPDAGVYPMVGPGAAYADMITGPHIRSRTQASSETTTATPNHMF